MLDSVLLNREINLIYQNCIYTVIYNLATSTIRIFDMVLQKIYLKKLILINHYYISMAYRGTWVLIWRIMPVRSDERCYYYYKKLFVET